MRPNKHPLTAFSVLLIAALLAACAAPAAAPTAAPVLPTAAPSPTEAALDPVAVAQAWMNAISGGDVDAALALVTDDVRFHFGDEGGIGPTMMRGHLNWWAGIDTKYHIFDCQAEGDQASCNVDLVDGCIAAMGYPDGLPMKIEFVIGQDGKVSEITAPTVGEQWDAYSKQMDVGNAWMQAYRAEELAKRDWSREYGPTMVRLCQEWETAMKTQPAATEAAAGALVDAINNGDVDAALAVFTDNPNFRLYDDKAVGREEVRALLDWMAGKEARLRIAGCEWVGTGIQCVLSVADGCMEAYGAAGGLPGKMTFYSLEDGTLRQVLGFVEVTERKAYEEWLEAEAAWASADRADEFAQAEGYSKGAGEMAVKLCREYAAAAP